MKHWNSEDYAVMDAALETMVAEHGLKTVLEHIRVNNIEEYFRMTSGAERAANRIKRAAKRYEVRPSERTDGGMNIYDTTTGEKVFDNGTEAEIREWLERNS